MGLKVNNLKNLLKEKINVHEFQEITNLEELINYSKQYKSFSIRFDRNKDILNLPFYIYDEDKIENKINYFKKIIMEMNNLNCTLLCSNGHQYDEKLAFNFVLELDQDKNFILELCDKKIPLRMMYNEKTTIIKGNIFAKNTNYSYLNKNDNKYNLEDIKYLIDYIIDKKYYYIEGTIYNEPVGILKEKIVIWQTN